MSVISSSSAWGEVCLAELGEHTMRLPSGLKQWQAQMQREFLAQGFPTRKTEDWKYTNTFDFVNQPYALMGQADSVELVSRKTLDNAYLLVVNNGRLQTNPASLALPHGVVIADLASALQDERYVEFVLLAPQYDTMFSQLNAALLQNGLFIYLPKDLVLDKPIHIVYQTLTDEPAMNHTRNVIIVEKGSQCTLVEEYCGQGAKYFNNIVTHAVINQAANFSHFKLQEEAKTATHIANTVFTQAKDSTVSSFVLSVGAKLNRENQAFHLMQEGASAHLQGLYLPLSNQHIDHHTRVDHTVPQCFSQQTYKGIIDKKGHAVFNGKVMVHELAQKTAAYQSNQNLLLADSAAVDTKPELEIYADDVKCSHGATVGQLDKKALFYLRSRGICEEEAKRLLTQAFANELIASISQKDIAEYIQGKLSEQLNQINVG